MSTELGIQKVQKTFETISKKLTDKTWSDAQDADLIEALSNTQEIITQLSNQIYIMTDYLEQYYVAIRALPLFTAGDEPADDIELSSPTQTNAARDPRVVGNRATRRAKRK